MKLSNAETLRQFAGARTVTMIEYASTDGIGNLVPRPSPIVGLERQVTKVQTNAVFLDDSRLDFDSTTRVEHNSAGNIVIYALDRTGNVFARMTYELN